MKLLPIKYKQPMDSSDARCALYALCNLFNDGGFLLFNNVGDSTTHNKEVYILRSYSAIYPITSSKIPIKTIYPHAITPPDLPIKYSSEYDIAPAGYYVPTLIDFASDERSVYHTVLALWGDTECVIIDSKKDFPEVMRIEQVFEKVNVHGFRILLESEPNHKGEIGWVLLIPKDLPHIFNIESAQFVEMRGGFDCVGNRFPNIRHGVEYLTEDQQNKIKSHERSTVPN